MSRKCPACGAVSQVDALDNRCPACQGLYRAEGPDSGGFTTGTATTAASLPATAATRRQYNKPSEKFIVSLRAKSNYPAFRTVVNVMYVIGIVLAVLIFISGCVAAYTMGSMSGPAPLVIGTVGSVVLYIVFRVSKEVSLMIADMSDATIHMAARAEMQE